MIYFISYRSGILASVYVYLLWMVMIIGFEELYFIQVVNIWYQLAMIEQYVVGIYATKDVWKPSMLTNISVHLLVSIFLSLFGTEMCIIFFVDIFRFSSKPSFCDLRQCWPNRESVWMSLSYNFQQHFLNEENVLFERI